jgi:hypothetical protein
LAEFDQAKQKVFGAHVIVVETICLFAGECQNLLGTRSEVIHHGMRKGFRRFVFSIKLEGLEMECNSSGGFSSSGPCLVSSPFSMALLKPQPTRMILAA